MIDIRKGDCLELMSDIPDSSIDLVLTDPPYLISYKTNRRKNKEHDFCTTIMNDDNEDLIKRYIKECYRIMKNDSALYMFCSSGKVDIFKQEIEKYFKLKNIIIWVKNHQTAGDLKAQYGKKYEMIIYANKGRRNINGKRLSDVWEYSRVAGKKQVHQNEKPIDLLEMCLEKSSEPNDVVFDGFMGSGSTGVACKNTGRSFIGIELDENYFNIAKERIEKGE